MNKKILIVDDESNIRFVLTCLLEEHGYQITEAKTGEEALFVAKEFLPDIILLDLEMPGMSGLDTLTALKAKGSKSNVIIITAYGSIPSAVEAMRIGAFDYITKPFNNEELLIIIRKALQHDRIERELKEARNRLKEKFSIKGIITINSRMKKLLETVKRIAASDTPVLIKGESGTGKELFANAIHQHSHRKNQSFVALNCGALPETLVESELFGFKKGSFSGANYTKRGLVEEAEGGTLFLDEIGEMGLEAQTKLLRFVDSGEFIPIGNTQPKSVDVRLIAASNRDLAKAISDGRFRTDLFFRLNVIMIDIPPLRERIEDIPLLTEHFLNKHSLSDDDNKYKFTTEAQKILQLHNWPGNVRELENVIRCSMAMTENATIDVESMPVMAQGIPTLEIEKNYEGPLRELVSSHQTIVEKMAILEALRVCEGNKTRAAKRLDVSRNTLKRKMKLYKIE